MIIDLSEGPHVAEIEVFSDIGSLAHVLYGAAIGVVEEVDTKLAMFGLFAGYQVSQTQQGEGWDRTGGEFIELALGIVLGSLGKSKR